MTMMFIDVGDGLFSYEYLLRQTEKGLLQSGLTNIDEVSADIASLLWEHAACELRKRYVYALPSGAIDCIPGHSPEYSELRDCVCECICDADSYIASFAAIRKKLGSPCSERIKNE